MVSCPDCGKHDVLVDFDCAEQDEVRDLISTLVECTNCGWKGLFYWEISCINRNELPLCKCNDTIEFGCSKCGNGYCGGCLLALDSQAVDDRVCPDCGEPYPVEVIAQQEHFDEETGRMEVVEYDMNAPSTPPLRKQILFPDPTGVGWRAVDWTPNIQNALSVAGVSYDIFDPLKPRSVKEMENSPFVIFSDECFEGRHDECTTERCDCDCHVAGEEECEE